MHNDYIIKSDEQTLTAALWMLTSGLSARRRCIIFRSIFKWLPITVDTLVAQNADENVVKLDPQTTDIIVEPIDMTIRTDEPQDQQEHNATT